MVLQETALLSVAYFLLAAACFAGIYKLICNLIRRIDSIPIVQAWNPNTHDKITSYAVEILREDGNSLFGWVAKKGKEQGKFSSTSDAAMYSDFQSIVVEQLRRGSIDEDMSSDIWRSIRADILLWETEENKRNQTYEGTNGVYHFYNPQDNRGLNDISEFLKEILWVLNTDFKEISGFHRATVPMTEEAAFLDKEKRNYTYEDSYKYFGLGYYHLSFYALGRVLHLLHDMAVPAHVRNDGHANRKDEHPEPLEYYADYKDSEPFGIRDPIDRWSYQRERDYVAHKDGQYNIAKTIFSEIDQNAFTGVKDLSLLMKDLAMEIHGKYYSFGTIPGNADSHNPANPHEQPWYSENPPDIGKCQPNPAALIDVINLIINEMKLEYIIFRSLHPDIDSYKSDLPPYVEDKKTIIKRINSIEFLSEKSSANDLRSCLIQLEEINNAFPNPIKDVIERLKNLQIDRLIQELDTQTDLKTAIEHWIKNYKDRKQLTEVFKRPPNDLASPHPPHGNAERNWHRGFHGPFCLVNNSDEVEPEKGLDSDFNGSNNIIYIQYNELVPKAIAYSAILIKAWFEQQYNKKRRGLGLWINSDASDSASPPELGPWDRLIDNTILNQNSIKLENTGIFTLGLANHLPIETDIEISLTLVEISKDDEIEFPDGIPLKNIIRYDFEKGTAREPIKLKPDPSSLKEGTSVKINKVEKVLPYNYSAIEYLPLPRQGSGVSLPKNMGGIRREQEESFLSLVIANPGVLVHKQIDNIHDMMYEALPIGPALDFKKKGLDKPISTVLRFEFGYTKTEVQSGSSYSAPGTKFGGGPYGTGMLR